MFSSREKILGVLTALVTVSIWASFLVGTRFAVSRHFTVEEVLLLRLLPAAIVMSPFMLKLGVMPRGLGWFGGFAVMFGASAVFPFLISQGLFYAPASDAGALAPGMLPFWTALAAFFMLGERPKKLALLGLAAILAGALMIGLWQSLAGAHSGAWRGYIFFLMGSGLWSIYSVIYRQSGLTPLHGLVIGLFWGAVLVVPVTLLSGNVTFSEVTLLDIASMIFLQSFVIAILAMILFSYAVKRLGAAQTAAFGALTPVLALLGGVFFLGEAFSLTKIIGVGLVAGGVLLASGILSPGKSVK
ncbi:MAG: DMT family transporter [Candidatus Puniceispirillaceae bacterium]